MNDPFQMQRELRYGAPPCDQILTGRHFTIGYSWHFRQAKWTLEIVNSLGRFVGHEYADGERMENFRPDQRVPWRFRASLGAFVGSGYDRGHLVASANLVETDLQNSETFLLSNMSPQEPQFNQGIWRDLESAIRELDDDEDVFETYVLTAPVFYFDQPIKTIGDREKQHGIDIPVPHAFIKSVFAENRNGSFDLWTFKIDNKPQTDPLERFLIKTYNAEQYIGGRFWDRVSGGDLHELKGRKGRMWVHGKIDVQTLTKSGLSRLPEKDVVKIAQKLGIDAQMQDRKSDTIARILALQTV